MSHYFNWAKKDIAEQWNTFHNAKNEKDIKAMEGAFNRIAGAAGALLESIEKAEGEIREQISLCEKSEAELELPDAKMYEAGQGFALKQALFIIEEALDYAD